MDRSLVWLLRGGGDVWFTFANYGSVFRQVGEMGVIKNQSNDVTQELR